MSTRLPVNDRIVTWAAFWLSRMIAATLRLRVVNEQFLDDLDTDHGESVIMVTWHGRTFIPITRFRNRGYWAMISTSRDGNIQNQLFQRFGFRTVRGSSSARGAVEAVLAMRRELRKGGVLAFTPDGPRGPSGVLHPGAVYLAQKAGCPVVPAGISSYPRIKLRTWDQYMIPLPFARSALIYGKRVMIPPDLDEAGREQYADYLGRLINELEVQAETLAATGRMPASNVDAIRAPEIPSSGRERVGSGRRVPPGQNGD